MEDGAIMTDLRDMGFLMWAMTGAHVTREAPPVCNDPWADCIHGMLKSLDLGVF